MRAFEGYRKGINLGGWLSQCVARDETHFAGFITEKDIEQIASWGLDHVRLPIDCDVLFSEPNGKLLPRIQRVDDCIAWCKKHGLKLVLDLHKTWGFIFDASANGDPDLFFKEEVLQNAFVAMWEELARRYGAFSDCVAFELLNEVTKEEYMDVWNRIVSRTVDAVRKIAPETWILIGGCWNNSARSVPFLNAPHDGRIVYNFHCYDPLVFTHQGAPWVHGMPLNFRMDYPCPKAEYKQAFAKLGLWEPEVVTDADYENMSTEYFEELFSRAIEKAEQENVPLYCGEYGVIDRADLSATVRWIRDIHAVFDRHGIGRALWTYKVHNFGLSGEHYSEKRNEILSVL